MISEGDFLHRQELGTQKRRRSWWLELFVSNCDISDYVKAHTHLFRDVMSTELFTVGESTPLDQVADMLEKHHVKRMPVMRDNRVVGVLSRADLVRALATSPSETPLAQTHSDR
ncbi:CBS domain-containing protein [Paraburkholderia sp. A1RO-5L]|uniref:CBS domain-containing protein n=1 Tax=unclassified Paraburkholderia TaxID=2615204 RepID=UPI003B984849